MDQFYITLPSNTLTDLNNTQSKFIVRLPQKLRLHGDWECGLCQIIYPHNWETLRSNETDIVINDKLDEHTFTVKIPVGCYDSVQDVISAMQFSIRNENSILEELVKFLHYESIKRVYIKIQKNDIHSVTISNELACKLWLNSNVFEKSIWATKEANISSAGFDVMYVYANILEPQIVGNVSAPLLRIVNVEGKYPNIIDKVFDFPHYIPVLVKDISDIEIDIKDDLNEYIPFLSGKVIIKLHF